MKIVSEPYVFDWDQGNINKNLKHGVGNLETEEIFVNKPLLINKDVKHSQGESRFQALGKNNQGRLLFLSFTKRLSKIRIISARDMNIKERNAYEKS